MENTLVHLWCLTIAFTVLDLQLRCCSVTVVDDFFSYGANVNDMVFEKKDDGNGLVYKPKNNFYPFYGRDLPSNIYININGIITFGRFQHLYFDPTDSFHALLDFPSIAIFWGDTDTRGIGKMYFRITNETASLQKATKLVRRAFLRQQKFEALSVIIATWLSIGYYNRKTDLVNTYQCILVSDYKHVFAILLYADIQWIRASIHASYGLVGFNSGDQVHSYTLPGSGTSSVHNLAVSSNVGVPGMWVYQISGIMIVSGGCMEPIGVSPIVPITLEPSYGIELGGTLVSIQGYCFLLEHRVQCDFDGVRVTALYENKLVAHCVVPRLLHRGTIPFQLFVDGVMRGEATYTALSMESTHQVDLTPSISSSFPVLFSITTYQSITLTWNPVHIIPILDVNLNPFNLDIFLYIMDTTTGFWKERTILAENILNNGSRTVTLPAAKHSDDILPLVIYVSSTLNADIQFCCSDQLILNIFRSMNQVGVWSSQYYYVNPDLANQRGWDKCNEWYRMETAVSDIQIQCPPTVDRARLQNSELIETNFTSMSGNTLYGTQWLNSFHRGAQYCFKQVLVVNLSESQTPTQQECCYQSEGKLITGPPNGGTINKVAADYNAFQHFKEDKRPFILCCTSTYPNCGRYYEKRPSSKGIGFNPILPAWLIGDPHFITFDSLRYTFNGHGEFILIRTPQDKFTLQGRMVPISNSKASVFSAIVAKEGHTGDRILIVASQAGLSRGGMDIYINGVLASFQLPPEMTFDGFILRTNGTGMISIHFSNGIYLKCRTSASEILIMTVIIGVPISFKNSIKGLLGVFNNDQGDDFTSADNSVPLPINSDFSAIHFKFGLSWIITDTSNSLFSYFPYESFGIYKDISFTPVFEVQKDNDIIRQCFGDPFCVYDWTITGSMRFGLDTLNTILEVEQMINLSKLITCNPFCNNGVCLPNNMCACSQGFTGSRCETTIIQECLGNGPCVGIETCEFHAGSYTCRGTTDGGELLSYSLYIILIAVVIA